MPLVALAVIAYISGAGIFHSIDTTFVTTELGVQVTKEATIYIDKYDDKTLVMNVHERKLHSVYIKTHSGLSFFLLAHDFCLVSKSKLKDNSHLRGIRLSHIKRRDLTTYTGTYNMSDAKRLLPALREVILSKD